MATIKKHYLNVENLADLRVKLPLLFHQIKQEQDNERLFNAYAKEYEAKFLKKQRVNAPKILSLNGKYYVVDKHKYYPFELYPWHTVPNQKLFLFNGKLISSLEIQAIIAERIPIDRTTSVTSQLENSRNKLAGTKNLYYKIKSLQLQLASKNRLDELGAMSEYEGDNKFAEAQKRLQTINQNAVNNLSNTINHLLSVYDFESIEAYNAVTNQFLKLIKAKAHAHVDKHLYKYAEFLNIEEKKLEDPMYLQNVYDKLIGSGAKESYKKAKEARKNSTYFDKYEYKAKSKLLLEAHDSKVAGKEAIQCLDLPLTNAPNFDYAGFANINSPEEVKTFLKEHIKEQRDNIRKSRDYMLEGNTVFEFPEIISQVLQNEGIYEGTVLYSIVMDKVSREAFNKALHGIALGVLAIAIGLVTYGTGTVALLGAGAVAGIGIYTTLEEIKQYTGTAAAYEIGLTQDAPSIVWVIVSVLGTMLDAAAIKNISKALLTAGKTFETSKKTVGLEKALSQLDTDLSKLKGITEAMRKNIMKQARLDDEYQKALKFLKPNYVYLNLTLGLDQFTARITVAAYYAVRKGVLQMDQFIRKVKAEKIIDDFDSLSPEEVKVIKDTFNKAKKDLEDIAKNPKKSKEIKRVTKRTQANIELEQGAIEVIDDIKNGVFKKSSDYHGDTRHRITDEMIIKMMSDVEAIYLSKSKEFYYFYSNETIMVVYATSNARKNFLTAYGKAGIKGKSGAKALGGLPTDPGVPVTRKMIENGNIPRTIDKNGTIKYFSPATIIWD